MTRGEIDDTTADPFCGFNLGSTVYRATPDKARPPRKFIFESPVVRLASDFGYCDVFENGKDIVDPDWDGILPVRSIIIYHYYDIASTLLGVGETPAIGEFAKGLSDLILRRAPKGEPQRVRRAPKGQVSTLDTFNFFDMFWQIPKQSRRQRWHGR
ncbi:MAG: hypothetical protein WDA20_14860 [Desulfuromonadales bacterium]